MSNLYKIMCAQDKKQLRFNHAVFILHKYGGSFQPASYFKLKSLCGFYFEATECVFLSKN